MSAGSFLVRRLIGIAPMYWIVTTALVLAISSFGLFTDTTPSPRSYLLSILFIPHFHANHPDKIYPLLTQGWTLNYEMYFYALFAVCMTFSRHWMLELLLDALVTMVVLGESLTSGNPLFIIYTNPLLLEFGFGILIARLAESKRVLPAYAGLLLPLGFVLLVCSVMTAATLPRVVLWGVPAAMIVLGTVTLEAHGWVGNSRVAALVGDASYSIYLTHILSLAIVHLLWRHLVKSTASPFLTVAYAMVSIIVPVVGGIIAYRLIEKPVFDFLNRVVLGKGRADKQVAVNTITHPTR